MLNYLLQRLFKSVGPIVAFADIDLQARMNLDSSPALFLGAAAHSEMRFKFCRAQSIETGMNFTQTTDLRFEARQF